MRRVPVILFLALFSFANCAFAQTGFPAFGSFEQSGFDAVNRQNLNAIFVIPIMSISGRGQSFQYSLVNNSLLWTKTTSTPITWTPVTNASGWGWSYGPAAAGSGQILFQYSLLNARCRFINPNTGLSDWAYYTIATWSNFSYMDWLGTLHPFGLLYTVTTTTPAAQEYCGIQSGTTGPVSGYSTDNTGYYLYASQNLTYVLNPSGVNSSYAPVDTNGNYLSQTGVGSNETDYTDTAGHLALKVINNTSNIQHKWQDSNGNYTSATTTTMQLSTVSIKTNFGCSGVTEYTGSASLPTEIDLPNGQKYLIYYEPTPGNSGYYTGRVQRVIFPTGGYYEYDYSGSNDSVNCSDGSTMQMNRVMNDGTNTYTWSFSRNGSTTTVTAPVMPYDNGTANNATYTFSGAAQTSAQFYQGAVNSGNLKRTVNTTWASNGSPATQITVLEDGATQNEIATSYDNYANLLSLKEYDWGSGAPGTLKRTTTWTYLNTSAYTNLNILNRPTNQTVTDNATGIVHSVTNIAYDENGYDNYGTCINGAAQHNDTNYGCSFATRGNPTTITTYTNASGPSGAITHHSYYDDLGNLVRADLDCCQSKTWSYSATTQYSFPDSSTRGSSPGTQLTTSATYNAYTGLVSTSTDENGQVTHYTYDHFKRLTILQRPDNAQLTWNYNDATPPVQSSVTASVPVQGSSVQNTITTVNGLSQPVLQQITDGTATYSIVATQYDPLGRLYKTSNPYTSSAQYWTATHYDTLGRPTVNILPDNSQVTFTYSTNTTTITDPAGKQKKSQVDGLGRLISVWEPDPTNGNQLTLQTSYTYSILNLLAVVTQGSQTRTYTYDDLGRATSVKIPETNQAAYQYQYNSFGLVTQRADPRGVITTYGYDNLNRLTGIAYNVGTTGVTATPGVTLTYDQGGASAYALGRLTSMADGVGSETYTYNNLGEMTQLQKVINGTAYPMTYAYNLAGELSSVTYPSGRNVQQNFDTIGRLSSVADTYNNVNSTRASGYSYNAAFQVTGFNYGNGVTAAFGYTPDRLLLQSLAYSNSSGTLFSTNYWYKTDSTNCPNGASGNNGQIQCVTDNVDSGRTASYSYDSLYRLTSATTNGSANFPQWGLSWGYDRYGNRLTQSVTAGTAVPSSSVGVSTTTNQVTGSPYAYDANGNMTNDGYNTLAYDAENRVLSATNGSTSGTYTYDGNSLRVQKVSSGSTTVYIFSGSKVIAEYTNGASPSAPSREYIYSGGSLLTKIDNGDTTALPVQNPSFEESNPLTGQGPPGEWWNTGPVPDWTAISGGGGSFEANSTSYNLPLPDGSIVLWSNWGTFSQTLTGIGLRPNTTYTLSLYVGHRLDDLVANYSISLLAGSTTLATVNGSNGTIPAGQFAPVTLTYTTGSTVASGNISIQLTSGGEQIDIDKVSLTYNSGTPSVTYYHQDQLSNRLATDSSGNLVSQMGHYPFGEAWYNTAGDKLRFTTYERDSESGNDYAMMRSYINRLARFSSLDPLSGSPGAPQSLNKYAYVLNDPGNLADPLALDGGTIHIDVWTPYLPDDGGFLGGGNSDDGGFLGGGNLWNPSPPYLIVGGRHGGGGGGKGFVDKKVLAKCIQKLFGVTLNNFVETQTGQNGEFVGYGPDAFSNGGNNATITVTNDANTYSGQGLKVLHDSRGNPPLPPGTVAIAGLTLYDSPYTNYTANNMASFSQPANMIAETQVHELGNSLHFITGAAFNPATIPNSDKDAGQLLENCVRNNNGFNKP